MSEKQVKFIKVENKIQAKAGYGEIPEIAIARSDNIIINNNVDFKEIAFPILSRLQTIIRHARQNHDSIEQINQELVKPIMELKANGSMFKYTLISELASVMLSFLEHIREMNNDAIEIIEAHEKTLLLIVTKEIKGDGGPLGRQLLQELEGACSRYYRKNPDKFI
jgi:hypothetical protein